MEVDSDFDEYSENSVAPAPKAAKVRTDRLAMAGRPASARPTWPDRLHRSIAAQAKGKAAAPKAGALAPHNAGGKGKSIEETYQKLSQLEHILLRPDTYIGSTEKQQQQLWVHDGEGMAFKTVTFAPGLYKIFDEILVNAADNKVRDATMDTLHVDINEVRTTGSPPRCSRRRAAPHCQGLSRPATPGQSGAWASRLAGRIRAARTAAAALQATGSIKVLNNGAGIPVEIHKTEGVHVPELIFGHLLTSSNYNATRRRCAGAGALLSACPRPQVQGPPTRLKCPPLMPASHAAVRRAATVRR